jgi:cob(I)alamin adenosyltransferase
MHSQPNKNIILYMKRFYSGSGDHGYTSLLGKERVPKSHPQPEAYGSVDEASAALGMAQAISDSKEVVFIIKEIQADLYKVMAELAATPDHHQEFQQLSEERVEWLEEQIQSCSQTIQMPTTFVLFGDSKGGAAFDMARTIVRRAERAVVKLHFEGEIKYDVVLKYLNRLSSLCFVLSLREAQRDE